MNVLIMTGLTPSEKRKLYICTTSNARPKTRLALSRSNGVLALSINYLFIYFQKAKKAQSCCVFLSISSKRFSSAF